MFVNKLELPAKKSAKFKLNIYETTDDDFRLLGSGVFFISFIHIAPGYLGQSHAYIMNEN